MLVGIPKPLRGRGARAATFEMGPGRVCALGPSTGLGLPSSVRGSDRPSGPVRGPTRSGSWDSRPGRSSTAGAPALPGLRPLRARSCRPGTHGSCLTPHPLTPPHSSSALALMPLARSPRLGGNREQGLRGRGGGARHTSPRHT